jgi:outer membrane protein
MKKTLYCSLLCLSLLGFAATGRAQIKIGTVDMNKIFNSYYKTKDAEERINEERNAAKQELDGKMDKYKQNLDEINKLNDDVQKPELSAEAKDAKTRQRDELIQETKNLQTEIEQFRSDKEKQLQEQAVRMRNGIVQEITALVLDKVKEENYDIVMDRSGLSLNGVPILIFAKDGLDFSDDIITELNKDKPKDSSSTDTGGELPSTEPEPSGSPSFP